MNIHEIADRVEKIDALDRIGKPLEDLAARLFPRGPVKDTLSGTWLGHPLHPMLTDIPIGSFTGATLLDLVGGRRMQGAANVLATTGLAAVVPTAAAGLSDWADTYGGPKRIGVVHAAANAVGAVFYGASILARHNGRRTRAAALGLMGMGVMTVGGYLGGHLTFVRGIGVNRNFADEPTTDWTNVGAETDLADGKPMVVPVDDQPTLLYRDGDRRYALRNTCSHAGGPLNEGEFERTSAHGACVTCPWHQSTFRLEDGAVVHGPATVPQPSFEVRATGGQLEIRPH